LIGQKEESACAGITKDTGSVYRNEKQLYIYLRKMKFGSTVTHKKTAVDVTAISPILRKACKASRYIAEIKTLLQ
jgi:hypothetical protein